MRKMLLNATSFLCVAVMALSCLDSDSEAIDSENPSIATVMNPLSDDIRRQASDHGGPSVHVKFNGKATDGLETGQIQFSLKNTNPIDVFVEPALHFSGIGSEHVNETFEPIFLGAKEEKTFSLKVSDFPIQSDLAVVQISPTFVVKSAGTDEKTLETVHHETLYFRHTNDMIKGKVLDPNKMAKNGEFFFVPISKDKNKSIGKIKTKEGDYRNIEQSELSAAISSGEIIGASIEMGLDVNGEGN